MQGGRRGSSQDFMSQGFVTLSGWAKPQGNSIPMLWEALKFSGVMVSSLTMIIYVVSNNT